MSLRHLALPCLIPLFWLIACDRKQPVAPTLEAGVSGVDGPTVKAPSNTNASAVSDSRIDVSWQDNSTNETGFEVWRSPSGLDGTFTRLAGTGANIASYGDAGLTASTKYCYRIRAFRNYDGKTSYSDLSNTACATTLAPPPPPPPPPPPAPPSAISSVPGNSSTITVRWTDNSANEDGFRVERSLDGGTSWTIVSTTAANVTSAQDGGRMTEQQVCYRVVAFNAQGDSPPSDIDCTTLPAAPANLTATGVDGQTIALAWVDNSGVEDGYDVLRAAAYPWSENWALVATLPTNTTAYRDQGLAPNTTYWYSVRARKDGGSSDLSNQAAAATATTAPAAPSEVQAVPDGVTSIHVSWHDNSANEDGFRLERSTDAGATWAPVGTTPPNWAGFWDGGLESEQPVCYRVNAFNIAGESPSGFDCTTPPAQPSDQSMAVVDSRTVDLTWTDNSSVEDGFYVCRAAPWQMSWFLIADLPPNVTGYRDVFEPDYAGSAYLVVAHRDGGPTCDGVSPM